MSDERGRMRWDPYVLVRDDEFEAFWERHMSDRKRRVLLVVGDGFDARALEGPKRLAAAGAKGEVWQLAFGNGLTESGKRQAMTETNRNGLEALFGKASIRAIPIRTSGGASGSATSRSTRHAIADAGDCSSFDDVIVDISAMPRTVGLTVIAKLLHDLDSLQKGSGQNVNLHVVIAESPSADMGYTRGSLSEDVSMLAGFSGHLTAEGTAHIPRVWFPVLGESQRERLREIQEKVVSDEICPVIPFPTRDPRRGDEIIDQHRDILFDEFRAEPRNILLACEYNPFEAYKQIYSAMDRYRLALRELGGCKAFVSPLSSKLLSVGAFLACYDHLHGSVVGERLMVGIPYVETASYSDPPDGPVESELYSMWIRGEWEC